MEGEFEDGEVSLRLLGAGASAELKLAAEVILLIAAVEEADIRKIPDDAWEGGLRPAVKGGEGGEDIGGGGDAAGAAHGFGNSGMRTGRYGGFGEAASELDTVGNFAQFFAANALQPFRDAAHVRDREKVPAMLKGAVRFFV